MSVIRADQLHTLILKPSEVFNHDLAIRCDQPESGVAWTNIPDVRHAAVRLDRQGW